MPILFRGAHPLREAITRAYRVDETTCVKTLLSEVASLRTGKIHDIAEQLVIETRAYKKRQGSIDKLLHQYDLSTDEGIALMCLAEALLRIPDKATMDKFISDKLSTVEWKNHLSSDNSLFINASTWSLLLTGKIFAPTLNDEKSIFSSIKRTSSRVGAAMIRPIILQMMKAIGNQFVIGQDIQAALSRSTKLESLGYRFSYDMLGEAARTHEDAAKYYESYVNAIHAIGAKAHASAVEKNPGISIKLSALHPRYEFTQYERIMREVPTVLLALAQLAKQYNIGLTVDAEETDRLDMSLDIFEIVFKDPSLAGWEGFGLAVQAYQKRATYVIDWLAKLAQEQKKRMMVRLVKGAYWDAEIKTSQILGLNAYPVFTRKYSTDISFLACAKKLLSMPKFFYPQFGTHNAYSVAAIIDMAGEKDFEFQCLQGMGRPLYDQIVNARKFNRPCRIYAPVGTHKDLLGYLVRRLLENGANSSFVNKLADNSTPIEKIIENPIARIATLEHIPHQKIPEPRHIYQHWLNAKGIDISNRTVQRELENKIAEADKKKWRIGSIVNGKTIQNSASHMTYSPFDHTDTIGQVSIATEDDVESALSYAVNARDSWASKSVAERATILEKAADLFETELYAFIALLSREGGRCISDCLSEVREAVDFCRYYAYRARMDLRPIDLPGPTGENNQLSFHPRGVIVCISPWNFPLAIFTGQIVAALVTGNTVIAKPAEQTPVTAYKAVQLLHAAGIPTDALQLLIGSGKVVGAKLVEDERIAGVMFTGSTATAKFIEKAQANRSGPIGMLIAETGGQNAMIVDSSALAEQAIVDIVYSAFNSAGQRCSALRVLYVQEEMAPKLLEMLQGYMAELSIGDPRLISTDVGPVIDDTAKQMLERHFVKITQAGRFIAQLSVPKNLHGSFFPPTVVEIQSLNQLEGEVFGPFLHVIRYKFNELDQVINEIKHSRFGLTLGIHSRIEATVKYIIDRMPVGNIYVNRNMIGAVVGVQPFGGEGLSGTGPKAGGPHYLHRLCVERAVSNNSTAVGGNAKLVSLIEDD